MRRFAVAFAFAVCVGPLLLAQDSQHVNVDLGPIGASHDGTAYASVVVVNHNHFEITNVEVEAVLTAPAPAALSAMSDPGRPQWSCQQPDPQRVRCSLPVLAARQGTFAPLYLTIAPANVGAVELKVRASWVAQGVPQTSAPAVASAVFPYEFTVRNTDDAGDGSFRAAILAANEQCPRLTGRCSIRFRLPAAPHGSWQTIRPLTPLPAITAPRLEIDARPRDDSRQYYVELDGSLVSSGHGLEVAGEGWLTLDGFAIGGFPADGISVRRRGHEESRVWISSSVVGVRPDYTPHPNAGRGVAFEAPASFATLYSVLSGANARSGVAISGVSNIDIVASVIGVTTFGKAELGNGASGIAILPGSSHIRIDQVRVTGNAHFGIAVAPGVRNVTVRNTIASRNRGLDIDHGLDGFSGYFEVDSAANLPAPLITAVTYDPETRMTTFSGTFDAPDPDAAWELTLVSDTFYAWPAFSLPKYVFTGRTFTVTVSHDAFSPRGGPVRAYVNSVTDGRWSTSELSEPFVPRGRRRSVR